MVKHCGITDVAVVESPVQAADGDSTVADVVYIDSASGRRVILEVSIVSVGSDSAMAGSARAGLEGTTALLRAREEEKRNHGVIRKLLNDSGNQTTFTPIVMSASGAMGPSMIAFLQDVYERAKEADKFDMRQQSELRFTWNTMVASSYWDMRLSVACVATDAEYQNRVIQRDQALNFPVVARQPHPQLRALLRGASSGGGGGRGGRLGAFGTPRTAYSTAVFNPLKLKSRLSLRSIGRGNV
jgi:hypothetical protein